MPSRNGLSDDEYRAYVSWVNMRQRCTNRKRADHKNYGMRGITFAKEWESFDAFLRDMGPASEGMTLDRKDNSEDYSKDNCQWATRKVQNNNKRTNVRYEFDGMSLTLTEWSEKTGIGRVTLLKRIQAGIPLELALTTKGFLGYKRSQKDNHDCQRATRSDQCQARCSGNARQCH